MTGERSRVRVRLEQSMCMATRYCMRAAPEVFSEGPDGVVSLGQAGAGPTEVPVEFEQRVQDAANQCPYMVIELDRADTAPPSSPR